MMPMLLALLDKARGAANVPFVITSAYRCEAYNTFKGYSPTSSHLDGWAVDIAAVESRDRMRILKALIEVGFHRIGIRKDFIHVDCDLSKTHLVCWVY